MHAPAAGGGAGQVEGLSSVVRDGRLDPQSPSQAFHPTPAKKLVPHLEIQADQQEGGSSVLSGKLETTVCPHGGVSKMVLVCVAGSLEQNAHSLIQTH